MAVVSILISPNDVADSGHLDPYHRTVPEPAGEGPGDEEVEEGGGGAALSDPIPKRLLGRGMAIDCRGGRSGGREEQLGPTQDAQGPTRLIP